MKKFKDAVKLIDELNKIIAETKAAIAEIHDEAIEKFCPVKVGDTTISNTYRQRGKTILIDNINLYKSFTGKYEFRCSGYVVKKGGGAGKLRGMYEVEAK